MMKLITGLCFLGVVHASNYGSSSEYMKIVVHDSAAGSAAKIADVTAGGAGPEGCTTTVLSEFLIRIPTGTYANQAAITAASGHLLTSGELHGACLTVVAATALPKFVTAATGTDKGLLFMKQDATTYGAVQSAGVGCTGALTLHASRFEISSNEDCGGITGTDNGIGTVANAGYPMKATLFTGRNLALQMVGPFSDSTCVSLEGAKYDNYPIVVPTETKTVQSVTVSAIDTSEHCSEFGFSAQAVNRELWAYKLTSTPGEIVFTKNANTTGMAYSSADMICTLKTDGSIFRQITYAIGSNGSYSACQESKASDGTAQGKYFRLLMHPSSIGLNPNPAVAAPAPGAPGSPSACSPAMGLQVSGVMALMIALVGMLM